MFSCYLFQLDNDTTCVNFTVERWLPVANMSRYLPIRVYDYYAPGKMIFNKYYTWIFQISNHIFSCNFRTIQWNDFRLTSNIPAEYLWSLWQLSMSILFNIQCSPPLANSYITHILILGSCHLQAFQDSKWRESNSFR